MMRRAIRSAFLTVLINGEEATGGYIKQEEDVWQHPLLKPKIMKKQNNLFL